MIARDPKPPIVTEPDPLAVGQTTVRLGRYLFEAMDRVNARLVEEGGFPLPTLVVHGGDDRLVPTASTAFLEQFPTTERRVYPAVRHVPHFDPFDGERIVDEMVAWLREQMDGRSGSSCARNYIVVAWCHDSAQRSQAVIPAASTEPARMPALYIGHGAPILVDDPVWPVELAAWARDLPAPAQS